MVRAGLVGTHLIRSRIAQQNIVIMDQGTLASLARHAPDRVFAQAAASAATGHPDHPQ